MRWWLPHKHIEVGAEEEEGSRNGVTVLLLWCIDHTNVKPLWFLWCKSPRKRPYYLSFILLWGFTEQLINISAIVLFVAGRVKIYIPCYWPCQQSQAIQKSVIFFLWKASYWSTSSSLVKPSEQQEMEEEKVRYLWWTNVCSFLKDLRKHANILRKWNNIRLITYILGTCFCLMF